jgi:hypothetical protein
MRSTGPHCRCCGSEYLASQAHLESAILSPMRSGGRSQRHQLNSCGPDGTSGSSGCLVRDRRKGRIQREGTSTTIPRTSNKIPERRFPQPSRNEFVYARSPRMWTSRIWRGPYRGNTTNGHRPVGSIALPPHCRALIRQPSACPSTVGLAVGRLDASGGPGLLHQDPVSALAHAPESGTKQNQGNHDRP